MRGFPGIWTPPLTSEAEGSGGMESPQGIGVPGVMEQPPGEAGGPRGAKPRKFRGLITAQPWQEACNGVYLASRQ